MKFHTWKLVRMGGWSSLRSLHWRSDDTPGATMSVFSTNLWLLPMEEGATVQYIRIAFYSSAHVVFVG